MGLSASMYAGTSGLRVHGEDMSVIGNNISNISTIGFKASRSYFEDTLSQTISVANGVGQVGRGVAMGAVMGDFSQGSLETTNEATDLAIGGNGFFVVVPPGEETNYYTRAGSFRFDKDGYLVDPHGYRLQGWAIQSDDTSEVVSTTETSAPSATVKIVGVPTDIKLENFQSPPQATSRVDLIVNLDSRAVDRSVEDGDPPTTTPFDGTPFTAMFDAYDAKAEGFAPGGASLHNCMVPHGPDTEAFEKASTAPLVPHKLDNTLAFMFESRYRFVPTSYALTQAPRDEDYAECWAGLKDRFTGEGSR